MLKKANQLILLHFNIKKWRLPLSWHLFCIKRGIRGVLPVVKNIDT